MLTHAARAAAKQLNKARHLWWPRAARAKGSGQSKRSSLRVYPFNMPGSHSFRETFVWPIEIQVHCKIGAIACPVLEIYI